jgi:phospholipase/carboxylesterase
VTEREIELGGLRALAVGDERADLAVIVLHGRQMQASDLAPFAHSLGVPAYFVFPDAPLPAEPRGRTWWPVDSEARMRRLAGGPMELSAMDPEGRAEARALLEAACKQLVASHAAHGAGRARRIVLIGFSQGGMLAMDHVLHGGTRPQALALLSSTRIAINDWQPRADKLAGLPVLVAHGHADAELAFHAGELLRDFAIGGGAQVTWLPFDGAHEIPLVVWRALRTLLRALPA